MKPPGPIPPKFANRLLRSFLRDDLAEEVTGDLDEKFHLMLRTKSLFRARVNYCYQVFRYLRPFAIRKRRSSPSNQITMFQNYFKIGFRNLLRNKGYSFINISGLATGMAVAMLIGLWIHDELAFDRYHQNNATIAQVIRTGTINGETMATVYLPYALGDELKTKYGSSFKHVLMASTLYEWILSAGPMNMTRQGEFIEPGAPEMLSLKMLKGTWDGLKDQHSVLLSASLAKVFFGDSDPVGKAMRIGNRLDVTVTGVYEDLPHNTHFYGVDFFAPWDLFITVNQWMTTQGFTNNFLNIYAEIQPSTDFDRASEHIRKAIVNNIQDKKDYVAVNPEIFLHPMSKWHLWSDWENGSFSGGLIQFVWMFGIVGVFVLLLACINFMNLSTARSERRAKEVGIRKAIGSVRRQLVNQFFSESFLVVFIAFAFAILLVTLSLGWFNDLAGKQLTMLWSNRWFWLFSSGFILFTGLVAGSYPALYLSSFEPVKVLKGAFRAGRLATIPRKVLVVVQFTVSVTLAIGTMIVYQQVQYAKDRPIGYDRNGLMMVLMNAPEYGPALEPLQNELLNTGVVEELALSLSPVTGIWSSNGGFEWRGKPEGFQMDFGTLDVGHNYGKTVGWEFIEGRDFSRDLASDSTAFVINEAAAKLMGLEHPVGELVKWEPGWMAGKTYTIIGVIKDMVMRSPFTPSMPTVFFISNRLNWINIRLRPDVSSAEAVQKIEAVFKKNVPTVPFNFQFADQEYAIKFAAEERIEKLAAVFAFLAILISCLGLFGLASFIAEQRTKEIGIRKVVGASVFNLWRMLSRDFVILVIISCCLSIPIGWYFLSRWLENYEYRTEISWEVFALAVTGAIAITLLTVSYQAVKAAMMNPVTSLRSE